MNVLAIGMITNQGIDTLDAATEPTHEEVIQAGKVMVPRLPALLARLR